MEQRFQFKSPSPRELFLGLWGKPLVALILALCIVLNPFHSLSLPTKIFVTAVTVSVAGLLFWRIANIARRDEQARDGFIELTNEELRVSLSHNLLLHIRWPDFAGVEQKGDWLTIHFHNAHIQQGHTSKHPIRVRLRELENPVALIDALRAQTPTRR